MFTSEESILLSSPFKTEITFTQTYRRFQESHPAIREAHCLAVQFPSVFLPLRSGDHFAGRMAYKAVGFSPQPHSEGFGYYCDEAALASQLEANLLSASDRLAVEALIEFWRTEKTWAKVRAAFSPVLQAALPSDRWIDDSGIVFPLYRMAGAALDYDRLLKRGIPGLREDLHAHMPLHGDENTSALYSALLMALDTLENSARFLAELAENAASHTVNAADAAQFVRITNSLRGIVERAPITLHEAIQLVYLYTFHATLQCNFGRMDVYLGDFLQADLAAGRTTYDEALDDLVSFWRMMPSDEANLERVKFDLRVVIGGRGRRNSANADQFALLALDATERVHGIIPQLSLRCFAGMDRRVWNRALDVIGGGATFPILYNDDVNIPALMNAFSVDESTAEQYVVFGCGETVLEHRSFGTPNAIINLTKALEAALHNGHDALTGQQIGLPTGTLTEFSTFESLFAAYCCQVEYATEAAAAFQAHQYRVVAQEAAFLYFSLLYDDCVERGKAIFSGGIQHLGGTFETYGNITTADSLTAIKHCVYDQGTLTINELVTALDANFVGFESRRDVLLKAPKFGCDEADPDAMAARVHEHVCETTRAQGLRVGLDSFLVVVINNSAHILLGTLTAASADGRRSGEPLTNGYTAANGMERNGITAALNSMVKLNPALHAGATHNLKFSTEMFTKQRTALEALLQTYFESGGTQAMITTLNGQDLWAAMEHPEQYAHLIVRVGGFSARFVDLPAETQREIVQRTLWGEAQW